MKIVIGLIAGVITGALLMVFLYGSLPGGTNTVENGDQEAGEPEPLYWVAPMDANYRRDKPGKSPMGMDLVPVYAEDAGGGPDAGPGTIKISPEVINNLGVRTASAQQRRLQTRIRTVGYVQYDENRLTHIHPRVEGWVETLHVKAAGDPIEKNQPLYALYAPELVNAQEELLLASSRNNARLITAAEERLKALQLNQAFIQQLKKTRKVQQTITFFAEQAGVVDSLGIREGFYVKPGTTLMSIGVLDEVWVEAEIFERQTAQIEVGLPVTMTLESWPGKKWYGRVDYIYPTLDAKTRTLQVRLRFENEDNMLKPNMFAQVVIHANADTNVLTIPKEAVIRTGAQDRVVLALGEGRFKSIAVKPGQMDEQYVEILAGLDSGEDVVVSAQFLLDSESGKNSDFKRMHHEDLGEPASAEVDGLINTIDIKQRRLNISRGAIKKWNRPPATMDFQVSEAVDLYTLDVGMKVDFTFVIQNGEFIVTHIEATPDD